MLSFFPYKIFIICAFAVVFPLFVHNSEVVWSLRMGVCIYRLTAFVLKSFAQSRGFIFIDPKELTAAKEWIIQHQKEDGSFPAMGRILNKDIQVKTEK